MVTITRDPVQVDSLSNIRENNERFLRHLLTHLEKGWLQWALLSPPQKDSPINPDQAQLRPTETDEIFQLNQA